MLSEASLGNYLRVISENPFVIFLVIIPSNGPCQSAIVQAEKFDQAAAGVPLFVLNLEDYPSIAIQMGVEDIPCYLGWRNSRQVKKHYGATTLEELNNLATALQVGDSGVN